MNSINQTPERTLGDGMENNTKNILDLLDSNITKSLLKSMTPIEPHSRIINLVPKYLPDNKKISNIVLTKPREPKFVPYEPYKAAVQPIKIIKYKTNNKSNKLQAVHQERSKGNVEINQLVNQLSEIRASELSKIKTESLLQEVEFIPKEQWAKEKEAYSIDIKNLKETNSHLECQLKFQAQVNRELKTLLVAAVGEDLESRVQHLTEDKLSLARALLDSANHLTSHQEQTEWLSGQCEVWRSKFLASSLMVEELARWKSALTRRTTDLQEIVKKMVVEHNKLHKQMFSTFKNLKVICNNKTKSLQIGDVADLSLANLELSEEALNTFKLDSSKENQDLEYNHHYSITEKLALKILQNPVSLLNTSQDFLCNALVGAAHSLVNENKCSQYPSLHPCCSRCSGEVQEI